MTGIREDVKELVIVRLSALPPEKKISIGSYGSLDRDEMINHVKKGDKIGQKIVQVELEFLKALRKGDFEWQLTS
jgi:hypothetical protein